jgi:hypothetical protein
LPIKAITRLAVLGRVLGVAIDVFEGVQASIAGGHEFDDADRGMARMPRRFLEIIPTAVVGLYLAGQLFDEVADSDPG